MWPSALAVPEGNTARLPLQKSLAMRLQKPAGQCQNDTGNLNAGRPLVDPWGELALIGIVIVAHGGLAREYLSAVEHVVGAQDAMSSGFGKIHGQPAVVSVQDFSFMGGSLSMGVGEAFIKAAQEAVRREVPYVIFTAAGGARMQEGALALMQMARTTLALNEVKAAGLPYIVVLTDPTTGGVTASYAMLGDIHLAEPNAMVAFAGRRVIEQTIREVLPPGFQRAEFLVERGQVDRVVNRAEIPAVLGSILETLMKGRARSKRAA